MEIPKPCTCPKTSTQTAFICPNINLPVQKKFSQIKMSFILSSVRTTSSENVILNRRTDVETCFVGTCKNCLSEAILTCTYNICCLESKKKYLKINLK